MKEDVLKSENRSHTERQAGHIAALGKHRSYPSQQAKSKQNSDNPGKSLGSRLEGQQGSVCNQHVKLRIK